MKTRLKYFIYIVNLSLLYFTCNIATAQRAVLESYIEQYSDIAINEMERTGIPASIKLAQAVLESDAGRSELASRANNHFGIKCGGKWSGGTYSLKDDDYRNGKLIKSCFRKYKDAEESFIAHSEFLRDPDKQYRYGFLFNIPVTDYKAWAHGLRKAGYATNPKYANLLIRVIKDYKLMRYDQLQSERDVDMVLETSYVPKRLEVNDVDYVLAREGETPKEISLDFVVPVSRIIKYNEFIYNENQKLSAGSRVYLQPKRNSFRGKKKHHYVKKGETMFSISQQYGLKLKKLYSKNKMDVGTEPAIGEKIVIRGWNLFGDAPVLRSKKKNTLPNAPREKLPKDDEVSEDLEKHIPSEINTDNMDDDAESEEAKQAEKSKDNRPPAPRYYTIKKGDTLYGIAKKFDLTLKKLRELNNFDSDVIQPGQVVRVK